MKSVLEPFRQTGNGSVEIGMSPVESFEKPFFVSDYTILLLFNVNDWRKSDVLVHFNR